MILLVFGMLLFAGVHLTASLAPRFRRGWIDRIGEGAYKGVVALLLLAAMAAIVVGWRSTTPLMVYLPAPTLRPVAFALLAIGFVLLAASNRRSRLRLLIRHPQLSGVVLWAIAHLLLNGDNRSLVLFGGMALWGLLEIVTINRRDGVWIKGEVPGWGGELLTLLIAAITIMVVVLIHPWLSGMPVL